MDIKDVKAGTYSARPTLFAWDTDKNGEVCMPMMLELCDCDYAGIQVEGRLYFDTDRVDSKGKTAADRSMETLRAIGLPGGTLESIDEHGIGNGLVSVVVDINAAGYPVAKFINPPGRWSQRGEGVRGARAGCEGRLLREDARAVGWHAPAPRPQAPAAPARANGNPPAQRPAPVTGFGAPIAGEDDIPF
jgi:hypothetical protein